MTPPGAQGGRGRGGGGGGGGGGGPLGNMVPSNYRGLPAAGRVAAPQGDRDGSHDRLERDRVTGVLRLRYVAIDPLRIASGVSQLLVINGREEVVQDIVLRDYAPIIPGSSAKGVLRTLTEALIGGCDLSGQCQTCVVCSLFGQIRQDGQLMGRVGLSDAELEDPRQADTCVTVLKLPRAFRPRKPVGRRVYDPPLEEPLQQVPTIAVKARTSFVGDMQLVNVRPAELGAVLVAMGADGTFFPRLGGGKYAGLGRVRVETVSARLREGYRNPCAKTLEGPGLLDQVKEWMGQACLGNGADRTLEVLRKTGGRGGAR